MTPTRETEREDWKLTIQIENQKQEDRCTYEYQRGQYGGTSPSARNHWHLAKRDEHGNVIAGSCSFQWQEYINQETGQLPLAPDLWKQLEAEGLIMNFSENRAHWLRLTWPRTGGL